MLVQPVSEKLSLASVHVQPVPEANVFVQPVSEKLSLANVLVQPVSEIVTDKCVCATGVLSCHWQMCLCNRCLKLSLAAGVGNCHCMCFGWLKFC